MTSYNADRRCGWNGDEEPQEAEQLSESKESEHQPDWVNPDRLADELRRKHVALEELEEAVDEEHEQRLLAVVLDVGDGDGRHRREDHADVRRKLAAGWKLGEISGEEDSLFKYACIYPPRPTSKSAD